MTIVGSSFNHFSRRQMDIAQGNDIRRETSGGVDFIFFRGRSYDGNGLARVRGMMEFEKQVQSVQQQADFGKPDIVIGSSPHLFAARGARQLAARIGKPFVLEVRDLWPLSLIEVAGVSPWHPFTLYCRWIETQLYRKANRIVSLLAAFALLLPGLVQKVAPGVKPVAWIPNGIDLSIVPPVPPQPERDTVKVVYAGSFGEANGLEALVKALELVPNECRIEVNLYGGGAQLGYLQEASQRLPKGRLTVHQAVKKEDIYSIIQQHHLCFAYLRPLNLYRYGISLNKLYDYFASGRPILWVGQARNNPVADAGAGVTVDTDAPAAIAAALIHFSKTPPEELHHMGLSGRAFVEKHHQFPLLGANLEGILKNSA